MFVQACSEVSGDAQLVVEATKDPVGSGPHRKWTVIHDVNLTAAPAGWHTSKLALPAALASQPGVELRWRYEGMGGNFMALDDIQLREVDDMAIADEVEEAGDEDEVVVEHSDHRREGCTALGDSGKCTAEEEEAIEAARRDKENANDPSRMGVAAVEGKAAADKAKAAEQKQAVEEKKAAAQKRREEEENQAAEAKRAEMEKKSTEEAKAREEQKAAAAKSAHHSKVAARIASLEKAEKTAAVEAAEGEAAKAHIETQETAAAAGTASTAVQETTSGADKEQVGVPPCVDANPEDCPTWAKEGECDANPDYMHQECRHSCGQCGTGGCQDLDADCYTWAKAGECNTNPEFMHAKCKKSCGLCS